jgi:hypothetical protein
MEYDMMRSLSILLFIVIVSIAFNLLQSQPSNKSGVEITPANHPHLSDNMLNLSEDEYNNISKHVRYIMNQILINDNIAPEMHHQLRNTIMLNRAAFENLSDYPHIRAHLFGAGGVDEHEKMDADYQLFRKTIEILSINARNHDDAQSFGTIVQLAVSLRHVVEINVEWSQYVEYLVSQISLTAPKSVIKYLKDSSSYEYNTVLAELSMLCETGQYKQLKNDLIQIKREKQYTDIVEKIINHLEDNFPFCASH